MLIINYFNNQYTVVVNLPSVVGMMVGLLVGDGWWWGNGVGGGGVVGMGRGGGGAGWW